MAVRAKFKCDWVKKTAGDSHEVNLIPVTDGSEENKEFYKYTPWGVFQLGGVKTKVAESFEPGKEYYIDITLAK